MSPRFQSGDFLLLYRWRRPAVGDLVVYQHPRYGRLFKRVSKLDGEAFWLASDHPEGLRPEQIGPCQPQLLRGKLLWHFHPR